MDRIFAIANQKGGVGKTTTAINLAAAMAEAGKKVLAIDIDPQGNMTSGLGVSKNDDKNSVYELLIGDCEANECIVSTQCKRLDLIPAHVNLAGAEIELIDVDRREFLLRSKLSKVKDKYDYIIIDCPPALSLLTLNAMTTADAVIVPIQCEFYALEGLSQLMYTIDLVCERLNKDLHVAGVVFTMYDARTNLSYQVVESVKNTLNQYIFKSVIPRNVRLAEAPSHGLPINLYDDRSAGAEGYRRLAKEVIKISKKDGER
ncbi:MAG: ParA family protein [Lachnospiraceae bacterium]|nr:ParA family protein [Lachnospiraceae bacterium]